MRKEVPEIAGIPPEGQFANWESVTTADRRRRVRNKGWFAINYKAKGVNRLK